MELSRSGSLVDERLEPWDKRCLRCRVEEEEEVGRCFLWRFLSRSRSFSLNGSMTCSGFDMMGSKTDNGVPLFFKIFLSHCNRYSCVSFSYLVYQNKK